MWQERTQISDAKKSNQVVDLLKVSGYSCATRSFPGWTLINVDVKCWRKYGYSPNKSHKTSNFGKADMCEEEIM